MRSAAQKIAFLANLLGALAAAQKARAEEEPHPADQTRSDAGVDDSAKRVASDAGAGQMPDLVPADSHAASADTELTDVGVAAVQPAVGPNAGGSADSTSQPRDVEDAAERQSQPVHAADLPLGTGPSKQGEEMSVVATAAARPSSRRLPVFGLMADVGVPDGLIGSLAIRPWSWVRFCAGGGTNGISSGWRAGFTRGEDAPSNSVVEVSMSAPVDITAPWSTDNTIFEIHSRDNCLNRTGRST